MFLIVFSFFLPFYLYLILFILFIWIMSRGLIYYNLPYTYNNFVHMMMMMMAPVFPTFRGFCPSTYTPQSCTTTSVSWRNSPSHHLSCQPLDNPPRKKKKKSFFFLIPFRFLFSFFLYSFSFSPFLLFVSSFPFLFSSFFLP